MTGMESFERGSAHAYGVVADLIEAGIDVTPERLRYMAQECRIAAMYGTTVQRPDD